MTPAGRSTLAAGLVIIIGGLLTGYPALTSMGASFVIAVAIALTVVTRRADITSTRRVRPERVMAGDEARTELTVTNRGRRTAGVGTMQERIGNRQVAIELPPLEPGESVVIDHVLPTDRRGVFAIGPLIVNRGDPLGLARRGDESSEQGRLIVHPLSHAVSPFPVGLRRDMDGIPSGEGAEGGVTFSSLREYVPGDDLRLVHWRSSARVGELMVRRNIDVHRPRMSVILDVSEDVYTEESFEDAVRAAASIVLAAITRRFPFTLHTTDGGVVDGRSSQLAVMDFLASVQPKPQPGSSIGRAALEASRGPTGLSCATITGRADADALASLGPLRHRFDQLTMVRMGSAESSRVYEVGGAVLINAATSLDFAEAWNRRVRQ